jgi:hypothetical protein
LPQLPDGLKWLILRKFNRELPERMPASLEYLALNSYTGPRLLQLPDSLKILGLSYFNGTLPARMPSNLQELNLNSYNGFDLPKFPETLKRLYLGNFEGNTKSTGSKTVYYFPKGVEKLYIPNFRGSVYSLENLTNLKKICTNYLEPPPGVINECNWDNFIRD